MKQYNLEDQLERKLNERVITPSADAWERIAFNRQQKKRKKDPLWYWVPVAAVLCIGLFITLLSHDNDVVVPKETIVIKENHQKTKPEIKTQNNINTIPTEIVSVTTDKPKKIISSPTHTELPKADSEIAVATEKFSQESVADFEDQKANEVVAAISQIIEKNGPVTNDEIDSLLLKAQREIAMEKLKAGKSSIDETALLKEAESEVEKSFRDKVYNLFSHKIKTIKVAIKQ